MAKNLNDLLIDEFISDEVWSQHNTINNAVFLDIGCGDMRYMKYCVKQEWQYIFSDYNVRNKNLSIQLDAHCLPFTDECIDVVLMTEVLEHLHHPSQCLMELNRIMKPGGVLILTVPFMWGMHELPQDYHRFTEFGLKTLLCDAAFKLEFLQRRGELIGLILSLFIILMYGSIEYLHRIKILSFLNKLLIPIAERLEKFVYTIYLRLFRKRLLIRYESPGKGLKGVFGMLSHWPLGYNIKCIKL